MGFDWSKLNFIEGKSDKLQEQLILIFDKILRRRMELSHLLFCSSVTSDEEIDSTVCLLLDIV